MALAGTRATELDQNVGRRRFRLHRYVTDAMRRFDALADTLTHVDAVEARSEHDVDGDRVKPVGYAPGVQIVK